MYLGLLAWFATFLSILGPIPVTVIVSHTAYSNLSVTWRRAAAVSRAAALLGT